MAKTEPSVDQWLREAKADPAAAQCGMFLTHNGVVRITPKAQVREGVEGLGEVAAVEFSYDAEGLAAAERYSPNLIITDVRMPHMDGIEMMRVLRERGSTAHVIVLTAYNDFDYARSALRFGAADYLLKPFRDQELVAAIERVRTDRPIETTLELVDIIRSAMPASALREKQHPAKRSFQAIRIAVNDELGAVRQGMEAAIDHLKPGGRLAVITFHSLEDRIVKNVFQDAAKGCTCPPSFPVCVCGRKPKIRILTKKPIIATREEVEENPRSRSAKLRVAERV